MHHSDVFKKWYSPHYRVMSNTYIPFLPLFAELDKRLVKGKVVFALEGGSASEKTTLSKLLESIYDCNVFHMDDFFLRPHQRTPERFAKTGGNIDWERFFVGSPLATIQRRPATTSISRRSSSHSYQSQR